MSEIIVLAVLGLIIIGPKELPELARTLGRFLNELKRSTSGFGDDLKQQIRLDRTQNLSDEQPDHIHHPAGQDQYSHLGQSHQAPSSADSSGHSNHEFSGQRSDEEPQQLELTASSMGDSEDNPDKKENRNS